MTHTETQAMTLITSKLGVHHKTQQVKDVDSARRIFLELCRLGRADQAAVYEGTDPVVYFDRA